MTKGQTEAKISEAVSKFEIEIMGKGPKHIKTLIVQDLIIIRAGGFTSQAARKLSESKEGVKQIKQMRSALFEVSCSYLVDMIKKIIKIDVVSIHADMSTRTGEMVILITCSDNMEDKFFR
ncbi:MAG: DUF2294 domain-containing protein [Clostridia bacterium]|nr:DUF2294 domain-containing protein [Clostridia bacterium]